MKVQIFILTFLFLVSSCGKDHSNDIDALIESGSLNELENKRTEIMSEMDVLSKKLDLISNAISKTNKTKKKKLVTVLEITPQEFKHLVLIQGVVKTDQNINLFAEFNGTVKSVHIDQGDKVKKGDLLLTIDDGGLAENIHQLKTQLNLAQTLFERQKRLWDQKIGSEIQYLEAKANYESRKNALNQAKDQLAKTEVRAPFSGLIDDLYVDIGNFLAAGQSKMLRIIGTKKMYVEADVPESYLNNINKGTEVMVDIPVIDAAFKSNVVYRSSSINVENRTFRINVGTQKINNLVPNLISILHIYDYVNPEAIVIPLSIISENAIGDQFVYVIDPQGKAQKVIVETGLSQGSIIEILSGLNVGDKIIDEGARSVKENESVEIISAL